MEAEPIFVEFEKYLQRRFPERRTAVDYLSDLRQFRSVCHKEWRAIGMHDIDDFVDQQRAKKLKPATVRRRVAALKTFFDFLAEEHNDLSWTNPVRHKRHAGKPEKRLPRDVHDDDLERVWQAIASARDRAWFALMLRGGLRAGEVAGMKLTDVIEAAEGERPARLRIKGKGQKERVVLLSADAYAVLRAWQAERGENKLEHMFLNQRGQPLKANGLGWLLKGYGQAVGLHLTPHQLRHTFARQLTEAGMPLTSLGKLMGHSQITTTQIYTAGADPQLAQAYQQAMSRVEQAPVSQAEAESQPHSVKPALQPIRERAESPAPNWEDWGVHLPPAIREASLDYIKRRWLAWPADKRRNRVLNLLSEVKNLWGWFLEQRPLTQPGEVGLKDLWAYQTDQLEQEYAAGTINRRMDYVLGIIRELAERDVPVDQSVFRVRYLPRPESLPKHLTEAESQRLENFIGERLNTADVNQRLENACLLVMLDSGLRAGECVDLRLQDLDLAGQRLIIRQGKGQRDRLVYLSEHACQAIQRYLAAQGSPRQPGDFVWLQENGRPLSTAYLRYHVAAIGAAVGIERLHPHRLRHTCATRLLNAGMDIVQIQHLLGHENLATTMIYARVQDATMEADYRKFTHQIERQRTPLSNTPIAMADWPTQIIKVQVTIDNSV